MRSAWTVPGGYAEYLAVIANPQHGEHEEFLAGGPFDAEEFDAAQVTKRCGGACRGNAMSCELCSKVLIACRTVSGLDSGP